MAATRFDELTRDELRELAPGATVVVPLGSIEQHGPHLPVMTDTAIVTELARRAAEVAGAEIEVVVAPTLPYGFARHHVPFGGTISIDLTTYLEVLTSIGRSLADGGFGRIVFLNGHGGNDSAVRAVGDRLVHEEGLRVDVAGTSYWTCAAEVLAGVDPSLGPVPGHAGGFETSCMMAVRPELIREDRRPAPEPEWQPLVRDALSGGAVRRPDVWSVSDGRTDDGRRAEPRLGAELMEAIAARVGRFLVDFHRAAG